MGITGKTHNKLFRVRTYDTQNLYQVGVNGVTNIDFNTQEQNYTITYEIDDIVYKTDVGSLTGKKSSSDGNKNIEFNVIDEFKGTVSIFRVGNGLDEQKGPKSLDTTYITNSFSFDQFTEKRIVKDDKLIGLISEPITKSELFIERDEFTIFERHQRLSEINGLAELIDYRNGYYQVIETL
jgi:hypothetical protein